MARNYNVAGNGVGAAIIKSNSDPGRRAAYIHIIALSDEGHLVLGEDSVVRVMNAAVFDANGGRRAPPFGEKCLTAIVPALMSQGHMVHRPGGVLIKDADDDGIADGHSITGSVDDNIADVDWPAGSIVHPQLQSESCSELIHRIGGQTSSRRDNHRHV